jgi:hypothetical protein
MIRRAYKDPLPHLLVGHVNLPQDLFLKKTYTLFFDKQGNTRVMLPLNANPAKRCTSWL